MRVRIDRIHIKVRSTFISILILVHALSVSGQHGKLLFHHLRLEDGLSDMMNAWVFKDSRGFVWISSIRGLNRFDGTHIRNYFPNLADSTSLYGENIQSSFFEDENTDLWFSTYEAINRYDRRSDSFEPFIMMGRDSEEVKGYYIFHLDKKGFLWLLIEDLGLFTFNIHSKKFSEIVLLDLVPRRALAIDEAHRKSITMLLYTVGDPGMMRLDIGEDHTLSDSMFIAYGANKVPLYPAKILSDQDGRVWIANRNDLVEYDYDDHKFIHTPFPGILTIGEMDSVTLLIAADEAGIWEYDKNIKIRRHQYLPEFTNPLSLLSTKVDAIEKDKDGGCWIASWGIGLSYAYAEKKKFQIHTPFPPLDPRGIKFNPNGFYELDNNRILVSTDNSLFELDQDGNFLSEWETNDPVTRERFNSLHRVNIDVRKNIWLCTYSGLSLRTQDGKFIHLTDRRHTMFNGLQLMDGRLIFSSQSAGLYEVLYQNGSYHVQQINKNLNKEYIIVGQDQHGTVWLSDDLQKLILLDPFSLNPIDTLPISGIIVRLIHQPATNTIWVAGSSGLQEIDDRSYEIRQSYNEDNILPCAGLSNMLMDKSGTLWMSCKNQIMAFEPAAKSLKVYGQEDGLPGSSFSSYNAFQKQNGEMWFGSVNGITKFHPAGLHKIKTQALPQITTLLINDNLPQYKLQCRKNKATNITEIEQLSFSYKESTLTFIVNSLEYSAPGKNKVRYKMEGVDPDWIEIKNGSPIRYANLPSKSLTFMVSAANSDGEYSPFIRKIDIDIKPPFYKTWWFISLSALGIIGLVFYIFYINFRRRLEVQSVRLKLYENLHDDVGSRLMAIVMSADALLQGDQSNSKLQHMVAISRSIVGNMRRLVWAIDPENESMNSLLQKIRLDKSQILNENIQFHLSAPPELTDKIVPGEVRYQVSSIINESMNNISKYAEAQNVWITFSKSAGLLHVVIRDDGKGFNIEETSNDKVQSTGYGMGNMQKRAARIKAKLHVVSQPGKGTTIEIKIPFN